MHLSEHLNFANKYIKLGQGRIKRKRGSLELTSCCSRSGGTAKACSRRGARPGGRLCVSDGWRAGDIQDTRQARTSESEAVQTAQLPSGSVRTWDNFLPTGFTVNERHDLKTTLGPTFQLLSTHQKSIILHTQPTGSGHLAGAGAEGGADVLARVVAVHLQVVVASVAAVGVAAGVGLGRLLAGELLRVKTFKVGLVINAWLQAFVFGWIETT